MEEDIIYEDVLMIKQNDTIFAVPINRRMEIYLYYWFLNCKKKIKKALNLELIFDSLNPKYKEEILKHNANIRNNKDLVIMNGMINAIYDDPVLWKYNKKDFKRHIKSIKKDL